jgi:hypothetical protein
METGRDIMSPLNFVITLLNIYIDRILIIWFNSGMKRILLPIKREGKSVGFSR